MKFRAERDALVKELATAGRATASRGVGILACINLDASDDGTLTVTGTDLDLTIRSQVSITCGKPGSCRVPAKLVADVVKSLPAGAVDVESDDGSVAIACGASKFTLRTMAESFPVASEPHGDPILVDAADFALGLNQVVPAASTDDARPILTGVLATMKGGVLRLVATDSYRLAYRDIPGVDLGVTDGVLIPSRALDELRRMIGSTQGSLSITTDSKSLSFVSETAVLTTRLIDAQFPAYEALIPESFSHQARLSREGLLDTLRRMRVMQRDNTTAVRLDMTEGRVVASLRAHEQGQVTEVVDCEYSGDDLTIGFNPRYLSETVSSITDDEVFLETVDALKPAAVRGTHDEAFMGLIMPVRLA